jgi:hypothetical protein
MCMREGWGSSISCDRRLPLGSALRHNLSGNRAAVLLHLLPPLHSSSPSCVNNLRLSCYLCLSRCRPICPLLTSMASRRATSLSAPPRPGAFSTLRKTSQRMTRSGPLDFGRGSNIFLFVQRWDTSCSMARERDLACRKSVLSARQTQAPSHTRCHGSA